MTQSLISRFLVLFLGSVCLFGGGCDLPERPRLRSPRSDAQQLSSLTKQEAEAPSLVLEGPSSAANVAWETWDAFFVNGQQVGYAHTKADPREVSFSSDVRYELESRLFMNQGAARFLQTVSLVSNESGEGQLLGFDGVVRVGPVSTRYSGSVSQGELKVETVRGHTRSTTSMAWEPAYRGVVAIEQSLRQRPMRSKGQPRNLRMLMPARYELATARLKCVGKAAVPLLDGQLHELWEIDCEIQAEKGPPTHSTIWTNEQGQILRTHSPALQLISYRTTKEEATRLAVSSQDVASIPVEGTLQDPAQSMRVGYKVEPIAAAKRANMTLTIPAAPGQYVRPLESGVTQILVSRRQETVGRGFLAAELAPTELDTAANAYVDVADQSVSRFVALTIRDTQRSQREVAVALTQAVHQNIADRPEFHGFSRASSVGKYWIGDPTERSIFLIALLRHQKIPARLVLGLKYAPGSPARFVYHVWAIAFVDGEWMHLDPSDGQSVAADRLVFTTTSLGSEEGDEEVDVVLPLLEKMRWMQIEIVGQN